MNESYLVITYRRGRAVAAYFHLPGRAGQKSHRSTEYEPGIVVDFSCGGTPLGVEIVNPASITLKSMNRVLRKIGAGTLRRTDLGPLLAA